MAMIGYDDGWSTWQMVVMAVSMIAFWSLVIGAIYLLITRVPHRDVDGPDEPRKILDRRLARGEIDADEYHRLREVLEAGDSSHGELP